MKGYSPAFARVYNRYWPDFARQVAPAILELYESNTFGQENKTLLDLCCGTGQLAVFFLDKGYQVVGLDLSEAMLQYAQKNAARYVDTGQAEFVLGNAAKFALKKRFGLVVSTYDSLNHLESLAELKSCFESVFTVLLRGGFFIFDLNTRGGLMRWNRILVQEEEEAMIVTRGIYDGVGEKAWNKITGFMQNPEDGSYERFDETAFNSVFEMEEVRSTLLEVGWNDAYFAQWPDLSISIEDPEKQRRVFFIAKK